MALTRTTLFVLAAALGGCGAIDVPTLFSGAPSSNVTASQGELSQQARLGGVVVVGAKDECLLPEATVRKGTVATATLANCEAIAASPNVASYTSFTTVTVTQGAALNSAKERTALAVFLRSAQGARSLSRDPSKPATVHSTRASGQAVYVDLTDPHVPKGVAPRHWRAVLAIGPHTVSIARYGAKGTAAPKDDAAIRTAVQQIIDAN